MKPSISKIKPKVVSEDESSDTELDPADSTIASMQEDPNQEEAAAQEPNTENEGSIIDDIITELTPEEKTELRDRLCAELGMPGDTIENGK